MTKIAIRGYHLDAYQHVNNARYLEFLEEARWQFLDDASTEDYGKIDFSFIIVNININYRLSVTAGDTINVKTEVEKIGNTSITFKQEIYLDNTDKLVCDAAVTFVLLDNKTGKPLKIEGKLKSFFLKGITK